nr:hypothetical transcript [Hymenolepis microstoma]
MSLYFSGPGVKMANRFIHQVTMNEIYENEDVGERGVSGLAGTLTMDVVLHSAFKIPHQNWVHLPPRGGPLPTYTHTQKTSINQQLTSNYHDPTVCHIPSLPHLSLPFSLHLCACLFYTCESLFCFPSRLFVTLLCLLSVKPEVNQRANDNYPKACHLI